MSSFKSALPPILALALRLGTWVGALVVLVSFVDVASSAELLPNTSGSLLWAQEGAKWSFSGLLASLNTRSRIIPFCVVVMALALFILMKKFAEPGSTRGPGGPKL